VPGYGMGRRFPVTLVPGGTFRPPVRNRNWRSESGEGKCDADAFLVEPKTLMV
jgi:hypothetical protein